VSSQVERLQARLGYSFKDPDLLALALTHRSCGSRNNERLEFLGDSILNHIIAEVLYHEHDSAREGELSRMRARLVKGETLAEVARELELGDYLRLGPGEMKSGGRRRDSILADTLEAIVGAMLLDSGLPGCRERVLDWFTARLSGLSATKDPKTQLQEYLQGRGKALPAYHLLKVEGEAHAQLFSVSCELPEYTVESQGAGSSRRRAEQAAALAALRELGIDD
jgi:ribonuclease-3